MRRQVPGVRDILPLIRLKTPSLKPARRRLENALTIEDLRAIARRRTPKAAFDYTDGAAEADSFTRSRWPMNRAGTQYWLQRTIWA